MFTVWQPRQERYEANKADACFNVMADWASGWMRRVIRFSGSNAPLKRWVTAGEDEKWTARGLPELAGIFTPRSLLNDAKKSYWGGRSIFSRDGPTMAFPMVDVYSMQCRIVGNRIRLPPDALKGLSEASMLEGRATKKTSQLWAFIAWRAFWESASTVSGLLGSDAEKGAENAAALFRSYFNALIVPGGFSDEEQALLNGVTQREVLRASFVYSLTNASRKGATLSRVVQQFPETPLPVILARPVPSGVVVEWIHQRELAAAGRGFFD